MICVALESHRCNRLHVLPAACWLFSNHGTHSGSMESVYQEPVDHDASSVDEASLAPQDRLRLQWSQQSGFVSFIRQKNFIEQKAELVPQAAAVALPGWSSPWLFALQGLVLVSVLASLVNWQLTRHAGKLEDQVVGLQTNL